MERENNRRTYTGVVVNDSTDKTISVRIETYKAHKLYSKRFKYTKKFATHDEKNEAKVGDIVKIISTKPYSKTKNFRLVEIVKAKGSEE